MVTSTISILCNLRFSGLFSLLGIGALSFLKYFWLENRKGIQSIKTASVNPQRFCFGDPAQPRATQNVRLLNN